MSSYPMAQCAVTTDPGDTGCYTWLSGTSMASPFVAGAAALVWSRGDVTSNQQVVDILLASADPVGVASAPLNSWTTLISTFCRPSWARCARSRGVVSA